MGELTTAHGPVRLVATDVDGTIAGRDHRLTARTRQILRAVQEAGVPVVIVTGRTPHGTDQLWREIGLRAPVISCTGALIRQPDSQEVLWEQEIDPAVAEAVIELGLQRDVLISVWRADELVMAPHSYGSLLEQINRVTVRTVPDLAPYIGSGILKLVLGASPAHIDRVEAEIRERFDHALSVTRGTINFLDVTDRRATKGTALAWLSARLGVEPGTIMAFGDSENDLDMLRLAGFPVAVANAIPEVRALARMVIGHHDQEAVADFLEQSLVHGSIRAPIIRSSP